MQRQYGTFVEGWQGKPKYPEKMIQFKLPAAHSVRIPADEAQGFTPLPYSATKRMTVFRTAQEWTAPVGREEMDERSLRVSTTHAWRGRWSRSEISSSGEVDHQAGCCGCGGRGFDTHGCFLLRLPRSPFRGRCGFDFRFLRPGRLPGGG